MFDVENAPGLLRTTDAATHLGCRPEHVLKLIRSGQLQAVDISTSRSRPSWRVPSDALARFADERRSR